MFRLFHSGPANHLYILQPGYDPLIDHYAHEAGRLVTGHTRYRPDRDVLRDRRDSPRARGGQSDKQSDPCSPGPRADRMAEAPVAPRVSRPGDRAASGATARFGWWTHWLFRSRRESRSDRVLDGDHMLETRARPRLENGVPKEGVRPT